MNCREVEEQEILERYVLGRLTDLERDAFEQHYFACDSCFSSVQNGLALQESLRQLPPVRSRTSGASFWQWWFWTPAFAALALIIAAGLWWYAGRRGTSVQRAGSSASVTNPQTSDQAQPAPTQTPSLEELAKVDPPPFSRVVLRGFADESQEDFRKAMQLYLKSDYAGAIPGLRAAAKASPGTPSFHFYLGACYLLTQQPDRAIESFRKTISLGNPGFSEPAHYYLAKTYLRKKDVSAAKQELQTTVQLNGSKASEAQAILRQLGK